MTATALIGATLLLPSGPARGQAVVIEHGRIAAVTAADALPPEAMVEDLAGGWLLPGFIDTQVNGGGDRLFNDAPSVETIRAIAAAHRRFGTTGLLPTLISDDVGVIEAAITAVEAAIAAGVPGVLGIHIEGPHLNPAKRGIHDATKFTALDPAMIARLCAPSRGVRLVTLAPELAPPGAIRTLSDHGVIVAAGHSMASYAETRAALDQGLAGFTHLFNAMTQLGSREPGMVGAALEDRRSRFGLIVDGWHVHPASLRVALAARGIDGAMLVTDAMPVVGGARPSFSLGGREITTVDGACRDAQGTLAGSALSMAQAVRNAVGLLGCTLTEGSRMASANPAAFLGLDRHTGAIAVGYQADLVQLDQDLRVRRSWIAGDASNTGDGA
ncbi:MAG: N-acetylglucosamine-6-phosphate deacetylase [Proteobacteria bacterium SG_bin6]|nr:MAG: N-acetylglucosamine-6-phosphate deacetylase [Proteobacteria bacterium SG_bin6]